MSACLVLCPHCARHVRALETSCPFCNAALAPSLRSLRCAPARDAGRLGRAARFAFGAALAGSIAAAGCEGGSMPAYGAPPFDGGGGRTDGGRTDGGRTDGSATDGSASDDGGATDAAANDGDASGDGG